MYLNEYRTPEKQEGASKRFVELTMDTNPVAQKHINTDIQVIIRSAFLVYSPAFITQITEFFDVSSSDEAFKQAAFDMMEQKLEEAQNKLADTVKSDSVLKLFLKLQ